MHCLVGCSQQLWPILLIDKPSSQYPGAHQSNVHSNSDINQQRKLVTLSHDSSKLLSYSCSMKMKCHLLWIAYRDVRCATVGRGSNRSPVQRATSVHHRADDASGIGRHSRLIYQMLHQCNRSPRSSHRHRSAHLRPVDLVLLAWTGLLLLLRVALTLRSNSTKSINLWGQSNQSINQSAQRQPQSNWRCQGYGTNSDSSIQETVPPAPYIIRSINFYAHASAI